MGCAVSKHKRLMSSVAASLTGSPVHRALEYQKRKIFLTPVFALKDPPYITQNAIQ